MSNSVDLNLTVMRRLMAQAKRAEENLHNVAKSLLGRDVKISYKIASRDYFGKVIEVIGSPGRTQVRVQNLITQKTRDIRLDDVTGVLDEV